MTRFARWAALAAVAAAAPLPALAQTSNVSMYGIADAGVVYADPRTPGTGGALRVDSSIMSTSR